MTDLPEVAWLYEYSDGEREWWIRPDAFPGHTLKRFLNADTAIPRTEADAMVAAVVEKIARERDAEAHYWSENGNDDERVFHEMHAEKIRSLTPADARAAFDRAVQEAVEAERERCARIAENVHEYQERSPYDWPTAIATAIRAPQETSE